MKHCRDYHYSKKILVIIGFLLTGIGLKAQTSSTAIDEKQSKNFPLEVQSSIPQKKRLMALVVSAKGPPGRYLNDGASIALTPGRLIPTKGAFIVPKQSQVIFRPMPGVNSLIEEDSNIQMKGLQVVKVRDKVIRRKSLIYVNEGGVFSSIGKSNQSTTSYQIQTPQGLISAKGTRFWVRYRGNQGKVGVLNGVVTVQLAGIQRVITLKQGDFIDLEGIGREIKVSEIRPATPQETTDSSLFAEEVSRAEGKTSASVNPFIVNAQGFSDDQEKKENTVDLNQDSELDTNQSPATSDTTSANSANTSTNTVVSPTVP